MEAGESIDVLESEEVNAYGSVVAEEEQENSDYSVHSEVGDTMSCHVHAFVCRRKFLLVSKHLPLLFRRTRRQQKLPAHAKVPVLVSVAVAPVHAKRQT